MYPLGKGGWSKGADEISGTVRLYFSALVIFNE
jgi:hypothetical protein